MTPELLEQLVAGFADAIAERVKAELDGAQRPTQQAEPWQLVDVEEAGRRLGRSARWIRERAKRGELRQVRLDGGALAFDVEELRAFARARSIPPIEEEVETPARLKAVGEEWWKS
ncbi:MAG: hypothetical protein WBB76_04885 [Gaiellaceae bacterium]